MLRDGELCACQITSVLELAPSTVSAHLAELRRAGVVTERKNGRWVYHSLTVTEFERSVLNPVLKRLKHDAQCQNDQRMVGQLREIPAERLCRVGLDLTELSIPRTLNPMGAATFSETD